MFSKILLISLLIILDIITANPCVSQTIVFIEDFEEATLQDMKDRWNEAVNLNGMSFSNDIPQASTGKQSLMMTYEAEKNSGGHLYKMFPQGFDSIYARFYVKFAQTHHPVHHFVHLGGYNPPTRWPQGGAGNKPSGNDRFSTGIEPMGDKWRWDFYTYWMNMRGNPQAGFYWGNDFNPVPPASVTRGEWICVELMMKINNPTNSFNGEQAFWINGKKIHHLGQGFPRGNWVWDSFHPNNDSLPFEGFRWRNDNNLKLNYFWLLYYMTGGALGQRDTVWFDDVVVSSSYNGPIVTEVEDDFSISKDKFLSAFPNPTTGKFTIEMKNAKSRMGNEVIEIYNMFGEKVFQSEITNPNYEINLNLPSGMYFYQMKDKHQTIYTGKIIIQY